MPLMININQNWNQKAVANLAALKVIDTTDPTKYKTGVIVQVTNDTIPFKIGIFRLDRSSVAVDDGINIISPTVGVGRWIRQTFDIKLDSNGYIDSNVLPPITITEVFVVASEVDMLALVAQVGDVCIRTDISKSFILKTTPPSVLANWQELLQPPSIPLSYLDTDGTMTANSDAKVPSQKAVRTYVASNLLNSDVSNKIGNFEFTNENSLYPIIGTYAGTTRTANDEASLNAAIAASSTGDIISLTADITVTATVLINKSIQLDGAHIIQTAGTGTDPVSVINITANNVYITSNVTIKHKKTTNTSIEAAVTVNATGFISNASVEFMEVGYTLKGSWNIGGKTTYTGALANTHRHFIVYNVAAPSIINNVTWDFISEATPRDSFVYLTTASSSEFNSTLKISNCFPADKTKIMRQFYLQDAFIKGLGGNPALIFENNFFNDLNGGIGFYDAGSTQILSFFSKLAFIANVQGSAGTASYKGMVYFDGETPLHNLGSCPIYFASNTHLTNVRTDYTSAYDNGGICYDNTSFNAPTLEIIDNFQKQNNIYNYLKALATKSDIRFLDATSSIQTQLDAKPNSSLFAVTKEYNIDSNRIDVYTEDGSIIKPYKTAQAAVNAAAALNDSTVGSCFRFKKGKHVENLTLESTGLHYLVFLGENGCLIEPTTGNAFQSTANNNQLSELYVDSMNFNGDVVLTGSGSAFLNGEGYFKNCYFYSDVSITGSSPSNSTILLLENCYIGGKLTITNINNCEIIGGGQGIDGQLKLINSTVILDGVSVEGGVDVDATSELRTRNGTYLGSNGTVININGVFSNYGSTVRQSMNINLGGIVNDFFGNYSTIVNNGTFNNVGYRIFGSKEFQSIASYAGSPTFSLGSQIPNVDFVRAPMIDTKEPTGFLDRVATLSFVDLTRTFTITGNHDIYIYGTKSSKSTDSIVIANTIGLHFIYYNSSGVLSESTSFPGFYVPLIAIVYWEGTKGTLSDERHGITMDGATHGYLHITIGSRYGDGLAGTFANSTFSIAAGSFYDEDIRHQFLSALTQCRVFYKNGTVNFTFDSAQNPLHKTVAGTIQYNNGDVLANVSVSNYVAYWVFATNDVNTPIMSLMGQREDSTIANARANNTYESLVFGQLPYAEAKLLYRVIFRNVAGTPTYIEAQDYRSVSNVPSGTYVATSHNVLSDLQLAGSGITWGHINDGTQSIYGDKTFINNTVFQGNISVGTGFVDAYVTTPIPFGGVGATSLTTTAQTIVGAINEANGKPTSYWQRTSTTIAPATVTDPVVIGYQTGWNFAQNSQFSVFGLGNNSGSAAWIGTSISGAQAICGRDRVVIGTLLGWPTIGAHSYRLDAWADVVIGASGKVGIGSFAQKPIVISAISMISVGGTVTAILTTAHQLVAGQTFVVAGVTDPLGLNGTWSVSSVIDSFSFTFDIGTGSFTATGTITVTPYYSGTEVINEQLDLRGNQYITGDIRFSQNATSHSIYVTRSLVSTVSTLSIKAQGALAGATDYSGGLLRFEGGISTGNGISPILFKSYLVGSSGTSDNTSLEAFSICYSLTTNGRARFNFQGKGTSDYNRCAIEYVSDDQSAYPIAGQYYNSVNSIIDMYDGYCRGTTTYSNYSSSTGVVGAIYKDITTFAILASNGSVTAGSSVSLYSRFEFLYDKTYLSLKNVYFQAGGNTNNMTLTDDGANGMKIIIDNLPTGALYAKQVYKSDDGSGGYYLKIAP